MNKLKKFFKGWTKLDFIWLLISNLIIISLGVYNKDSALAIVSAVTGVTCVIFVSKQMMANYFVGLINVVLYAYLAFESKLYGDFMLNAFYYFPMQFIGFYMWNKSKNKSDIGKIESKMLNGEQRITLSIICLASVILYAYILKLLGGNIPLIDSASTLLSVIAMILMVKQYTEQWHLWVLVNIVSIIMWAISLSQGSGDMATLLMWIVYLINSLFGLYNWKKANKLQK